MTAGNVPRVCTEIRACAGACVDHGRFAGDARIRETTFHDLNGRTHIRTDGRTDGRNERPKESQKSQGETRPKPQVRA